MVELLAFDEAGNTTERIFNVVYEQTQTPEDNVNPPSPGTDITPANDTDNDTDVHHHTYESEWKSNANGHWQTCSCGETSAVIAHTSGEWIVDTPAAQTTNGSRHKQCTTCGYVIETETISATGIGSKYRITDGANQSWELDPTKEVTITCDGAIEDFIGLEVDGESVGEEHYTAISGSTIITLKPSYLQTLSTGSHTIELLYTDGSVQTNFTIQTAENNNIPPSNQPGNVQTDNEQSPSSSPTVSPQIDNTIDVPSPEANDKRSNIPWFLLGGTALIILSVMLGIAVKRRKH
jgi:hypothetical protein